MSPIDLYVFVERSMFSTDGEWLDALSRLAAMDVAGLAIQVRTSGEPPERAAELGRRARAATLSGAIPVFLNGSSQEAFDRGYAGVHWPEALIPSSRDETPLLKGASVHSPEAAVRAEQAGAGLLVAGTVFDAGSKPVPGAGLDALRRIAAATTLPVLAIGGVTAERVASCLAAGAAGVAVVTAVLRAPDMAAAVSDLRRALDAAKVAGGLP